MKKKLEILRILYNLEKACGRGGGFRLGSINEFASFSRSTVYRQLKQLVRLGAVHEAMGLYRNEPCSTYSITQSGKDDFLGLEMF